MFPGGFIRWREHPAQTALREGREETGLQLEVRGLLGFSSVVYERITRMNTLTLIFQAEVVSGELKSSIEGKACWRSSEELSHLLQRKQQGVLEHFLHHRHGELAEDDSEVP